MKAKLEEQNRSEDKQSPSLESFFKIGISENFILIREDFPIEAVSPGEFSRLLAKMFRKNDEARHGK